jgi:hypothetical protein
MRSRSTTARAAVALLAMLLLAGCSHVEQIIGPQTVVPPGVQSSQTAAQVTQKMLAEIAASEKTLGRALAPARIMRIQLLRAGEMFELKHFDGTNPDQVGMSPDDGPGWMVEAVGTFIGVDPQTDQIDSLGTHGFHLWGDAGGESWGFIPCWTRRPMPAESKEGVCQP